MFNLQTLKLSVNICFTLPYLGSFVVVFENQNDIVLVHTNCDNNLTNISLAQKICSD